MAPKGAEKERESLQNKLEREAPKHLDGTVLPDEKSFDLQEELKRHGGIDTLVPRPGADSLVRQRLDLGLEKALSCAAHVHLTAWYAYERLVLFCGTDIVSLPGHAKFFRKRAFEYHVSFNEIACFASGRGGDMNLRPILPPPELNVDKGGAGLAAMEFSLATCKLVYEKQLQLYKAAEIAGDGGAMYFVTDSLISPMVESIKQTAGYITTLRRMGPGLGEYMFDQHLLLGVDPRALLAGLSQSSTVEPPSKKARVATSTNI